MSYKNWLYVNLIKNIIVLVSSIWFILTARNYHSEFQSPIGIFIVILVLDKIITEKIHEAKTKNLNKQLVAMSGALCDISQTCVEHEAELPPEFKNKVHKALGEGIKESSVL